MSSRDKAGDAPPLGVRGAGDVRPLLLPKKREMRPEDLLDIARLKFSSCTQHSPTHSIQPLLRVSRLARSALNPLKHSWRAG